MHYWEVWHGKKPFEQFFNIKPRFCSEFGFQSWSSLPTVKTFCPPDQFDIYSPTMKAHQKNTAGNDIIQNMFHVYFKIPKTFEEQLYLSQVQQAYAIRMGCEWFRTLKPITRGMMYWQLNDCWPAASWSSIEYNGRWKQLQYHAARFYAPLLATFYMENKTKTAHLYVVNDLVESVDVKGYVKFIGFVGKVIRDWSDIEYEAGSDSAGEVWRLDLADWTDEDRQSGFFYCEFAYEDGSERKSFSNFFFACQFKDANMKVARISVSVKLTDVKTEIYLGTDYPAFFVHLEADDVRRFSDSSFVLLPGAKKIVSCPERVTLKQIVVYQLAAVGATGEAKEI
jgi:beta-mannosidase